MAGNGDGGMEIGVTELAVGWVSFQVGLTPSVDLKRGAALLNESLIRWLMAQPSLRVRAALPIVVDGNTAALHLWYDR
jgi:hypothetical protein